MRHEVAQEKTVIYRVAQEVLNNIAKHSKADLVHLRLGKTGAAIELNIQDNGEGFYRIETLTANSSQKGLGLSSMRERTGIQGRSYAIESSPGSGTIVAHHGRSGKEHLNLLVSSCLHQMLDSSGRTRAQGSSSLMSKALRAPGMRRGQGLRILSRVVTHGRKRR